MEHERRPTPRHAPPETRHQRPAGQAPAERSQGPQQTLGNQGVLESTGLAEAEAAQSLDPDLEALQHLRAGGPYGPQDIVAPLSGVPGTVGLGGFSARFDPLAELLTVTLEVTFQFVDGMSLQGGALVAPSEAPSLAPAAAALNANLATAAERQQVVDDHFAWTDEVAWGEEFEETVEGAWSFEHAIVSPRPGWEDVSVETCLDVDVLGSGGGGHCQITVVKVPEPAELQLIGAAPAVGPAPTSPIVQGGSVHSGGSTNLTEDTDPRNNQMTLSSTHLQPSATNLLQIPVYFAEGSADLTADGQNRLNTAIARYQDANLPEYPPVRLVGHASSEGSRRVNARLAQQRVDAVRNYLQTNGFTHLEDRVSEENEGEAGADATPAWRRVDVICDEGQAQVVAVHEVGHALGLGDRYTNQGIRGTGQSTGTEAPHGGLADAAGAVRPVHENNSDIMSLGNRISASSYAPFVHGLKQITGEQSWVIG